MKTEKDPMFGFLEVELFTARWNSYNGYRISLLWIDGWLFGQPVDGALISFEFSKSFIGGSLLFFSRAFYFGYPWGNYNNPKRTTTNHLTPAPDKADKIER